MHSRKGKHWLGNTPWTTKKKQKFDDFHKIYPQTKKVLITWLLIWLKLFCPFLIHFRPIPNKEKC